MDTWKRRFAANKRRLDLRERAIEYLGGRCHICGYNRSAAAFDFHHRDPAAKDFTVSAAMTSWERIKPELDKCYLLCATCHREVHDGMHPSYLEIDSTWDKDTIWQDDLE